MADVVEYLIGNVRYISLAIALIVILIFAFCKRYKIKESISDIITVGVLGASIPVWLLFVVSAFKPEIAHKLGEFPEYILIMGVVGIISSGIMIKDTFKK